MIKHAVALLLVLLSLSSLQAQSIDSLQLKIGQMILIGVPGTTVDQTVLNEVAAGKAGSILLFEKNIAAQDSYSTLKKMIYTYQKAAPIPLFVAIDQEGGRVNRLKEKYGFPRSISAEAMGKAATLDSVRFYASSTAATLAGLGFNINFAPCVDVAVNPDNPVIARVERSFSAYEDSVAILAEEFIKQHHKVGVLTALKHFPGHGSSKADTHLGMADVTPYWEPRELVPYQRLISSGNVDAIMTAHIVNENLEPAGLPGTLSKEVISELLRNQLGFEGVVFSDDMQMQAITDHYGFAKSIKQAIHAGVDVLLFSNNIAGSQVRTVDRVYQIIRESVEAGEISEERIDESFRRIMALKQRIH